MAASPASTRVCEHDDAVHFEDPVLPDGYVIRECLTCGAAVEWDLTLDEPAH